VISGTPAFLSYISEKLGMVFDKRGKLYLNNQVVSNLIPLLVYSALMLSIINPGEGDWKITFVFYILIVIFSTPIYLITSFILIPKLLYKRKFFVLIILTIVTIIVTAFFCITSTLYMTRLFFSNIDSEFVLPELLSDHSMEDFLYYLFLFCWNSILGIFSSGAIRIYFSRRNMEKQMIDIQNEKVTAELAYLRNQLNPEFLLSMMNTLKENITEEKEEVKEAVDTFSNLLQYQLYECTNDEIDIEKELKYLSSYIQVQKYRLEAGSDIRLKTEGDLANFKIAPLLILPLIENAFKHISHFNESSQNKIHIDINLSEDNILLINVRNSYEEVDKAKLLIQSGSGGVGLVNLKRRLDLIYPGRHEFRAGMKDGFFNAELSIQI